MVLNEISGGRKSDAWAKKILDRLIKELKTPDIIARIGSKMPAQIIVDSGDFDFELGGIEYVQLDFTFNPRLGMQEVATNAAYVRDGSLDRIEVEITYPNRPFRITDIADIYPELLENIRHELEHASQVLDDAKSSIDELDTLNDFVTYYTDPTEVAAFVSGLMLKAKSGRGSLRKMIKDKIDAVLNDAEDAGLSDSEISKLGFALTSAFVKYAEKRYPQMK